MTAQFLRRDDNQTMELPVINSNEGCQNAEICRDCGGECCQRSAGIAWPQDFGPESTLVETLVSYLVTGFWAVDCWDGDPRPQRKRKSAKLDQVWYIRPAHKNAVGKLVDRSWGGECRLWCKEYGCSLSFENRPRGCRMLIPDKSHRCGYGDTKENGKESAALAWIPYQRHIKRAMSIARKQMQPKVTTRPPPHGR